MSITSIGLPNLIEQYTLLIKNRKGFDDLKKIDKKNTSTLSKIVKLGTQNVRIGDIKSLINATEERGLMRRDVRNLRSIKCSINDLASTLLTQSQTGSADEEELDVRTPQRRKQNQSSISSSSSTSKSEVATSEITLDDGLKLELTNHIDSVVSTSLSNTKNQDKPSVQRPRRWIAMKNPLQLIPNPIKNAAATVVSLVSSSYYFFRPTNRIDTAFEVFSSKKLPECLIKSILQYDQEYFNDIIDIITKGNKISDFVKRIAESITVLNLRAYPKTIKNIAEILKHFKNVKVLTTPTYIAEKDLEAAVELKSLLELDLTECKNITDTGLALLTTSTTLQSINLLWAQNITDTGLGALATIKTLKSLIIRSDKITDIGLGSLTALTDLESLDLYGKITNNGLEKITTFKNLHFLTLGSSNRDMTDTDLATLATITTLQSLNLLWSQDFTDDGLGALATLKDLKYLHLNSSKITGIGLASLTTLTNLEYLDLRGCWITDTGIETLVTFPNLQSLILGDSGRDISDTGLGALAALSKLTHLDLSGCHNITSAGLASLNALPSLQFLNLSCCGNVKNLTDAELAIHINLQHLHLRSLHEITNDDVNYIVKNLPLLKSLNLFNCGYITDNGLVSLETLSALESLDITSIGSITDNGLCSIAKLTTLRTLSLSWPRSQSFTGIGLDSLKALTNLQFLNIMGDKITTDSLIKIVEIKNLKKICLINFEFIPEETLTKAKLVNPKVEIELFSNKH